MSNEAEELKQMSVDKSQLSVDETGRVTMLAPLVIPSGSFFLIDAPSFAIGTLTMQNNSAILISPQLEHCNLVITAASMTGTVGIKSLGAAGAHAGPNTGDPWAQGIFWQADGGHGGAKGYAGIAGGDGQTAAAIDLQIGINSLNGELAVQSIGGNGGNGSNGCKGQVGGRGSGPFKKDGKGGDGGDGGKSGKGGDGRNVVVAFYGSNPNLEGLIKPLSKGGTPGVGGGPGEQAPGGNNNPDKWGAAGSPGGTGNSGTAGTTYVQRISQP